MINTRTAEATLRTLTLPGRRMETGIPEQTPARDRDAISTRITKSTRIAKITWITGITRLTGITGIDPADRQRADRAGSMRTATATLKAPLTTVSTAVLTAVSAAATAGTLKIVLFAALVAIVPATTAVTPGMVVAATTGMTTGKNAQDAEAKLGKMHTLPALRLVRVPATAPAIVRKIARDVPSEVRDLPVAEGRDSPPAASITLTESSVADAGSMQVRIVRITPDVPIVLTMAAASDTPVRSMADAVRRKETFPGPAGMTALRATAAVQTDATALQAAVSRNARTVHARTAHARTVHGSMLCMMLQQ